jgi:hypothetical protein
MKYYYFMYLVQKLYLFVVYLITLTGSVNVALSNRSINLLERMWKESIAA